jgi:hypothetical protein
LILVVADTVDVEAGVTDEDPVTALTGSTVVGDVVAVVVDPATPAVVADAVRSNARTRSRPDADTAPAVTSDSIVVETDAVVVPPVAPPMDGDSIGDAVASVVGDGAVVVVDGDGMRSSTVADCVVTDPTTDADVLVSDVVAVVGDVSAVAPDDTVAAVVPDVDCSVDAVTVSPTSLLMLDEVDGVTDPSVDSATPLAVRSVPDALIGVTVDVSSCPAVVSVDTDAVVTVPPDDDEVGLDDCAVVDDAVTAPDDAVLDVPSDDSADPADAVTVVVAVVVVPALDWRSVAVAELVTGAVVIEDDVPSVVADDCVTDPPDAD